MRGAEDITVLCEVLSVCAVVFLPDVLDELLRRDAARSVAAVHGVNDPDNIQPLRVRLWSGVV